MAGEYSVAVSMFSSILLTHYRQNFGALCAFAVGFIVILLFLTEVNQRLAGESNVILFKRGSKPAAIKAAKESSHDEEKGNSATSTSNGDQGLDNKVMKEAAPESHGTFSFHHLNYSVPVGKDESRKLLDDVSGYAAPGKLTALMGESGAGKTTLLNVLADRTTSGVVTGDRFLNGNPLPEDFQAHTYVSLIPPSLASPLLNAFSHHSGYCQQLDTHQRNATVREALLFSACLRQPKEVPFSDKKS